MRIPFVGVIHMETCGDYPHYYPVKHTDDFFCFLFKEICFLKLTKSRVELLFSQVLVVVDIVVLKQVEQRAFKHILEEPLLLDDL